MLTPLLEHRHYIIRAEIDNGENIYNLDLIEQWMKDLIKQIEMEILIPPAAKYCDEKNNRGVTAIAAIKTSHMAIHIWDELDPAVMQFDLYSCKGFDEKAVVDLIDETFGLHSYVSIMLDRETFIRLV